MTTTLYKPGLIAVFLCGVILTGSAKAGQVNDLPQAVTLRNQKTLDVNTACSISRHSDTAQSYYRFFVADDRIAVFMNPAACASPQYPFEIDTVHLTLFGGFGANWPVEVAIEIWSSAGADSCNGPVTLLKSDTVTLDQATYEIPNVGAIVYTAPQCVTGPFYVSVRYTGGSVAPFPSVTFDNHMPGDSCVNWGYATVSGWKRWNHFWSLPNPGNPIIWVAGQTVSGLCGSPACCTGVTGNVNLAGIVDLADLSALVSYLTGGGYILPCYAEANVNAAGIVDLADLSALVSYLTGGGYALPNCP